VLDCVLKSASTDESLKGVRSCRTVERGTVSKDKDIGTSVRARARLQRQEQVQIEFGFAGLGSGDDVSREGEVDSKTRHRLNTKVGKGRQLIHGIISRNELK
jgi:hypothetical protein